MKFDISGDAEKRSHQLHRGICIISITSIVGCALTILIFFTCFTILDSHHMVTLLRSEFKIIEIWRYSFLKKVQSAQISCGALSGLGIAIYDDTLTGKNDSNINNPKQNEGLFDLVPLKIHVTSSERLTHISSNVLEKLPSDIVFNQYSSILLDTYPFLTHTFLCFKGICDFIYPSESLISSLIGKHILSDAFLIPLIGISWKNDYWRTSSFIKDAMIGPIQSPLLNNSWIFFRIQEFGITTSADGIATESQFISLGYSAVIFNISTTFGSLISIPELRNNKYVYTIWVNHTMSDFHGHVTSEFSCVSDNIFRKYLLLHYSNASFSILLDNVHTLSSTARSIVIKFLFLSSVNYDIRIGTNTLYFSVHLRKSIRFLVPLTVNLVVFIASLLWFLTFLLVVWHYITFRMPYNKFLYAVQTPPVAIMLIGIHSHTETMNKYSKVMSRFFCLFNSILKARVEKARLVEGIQVQPDTTIVAGLPLLTVIDVGEDVIRTFQRRMNHRKFKHLFTKLHIRCVVQWCTDINIKVLNGSEICYSGKDLDFLLEIFNHSGTPSDKVILTEASREALTTKRDIIVKYLVSIRFPATSTLYHLYALVSEQTENNGNIINLFFAQCWIFLMDAFCSEKQHTYPEMPSTYIASDILGHSSFLNKAEDNLSVPSAARPSFYSHTPLSNSLIHAPPHKNHLAGNNLTSKDTILLNSITNFFHSRDYSHTRKSFDYVNDSSVDNERILSSANLAKDSKDFAESAESNYFHEIPLDKRKKIDDAVLGMTSMSSIHSASLSLTPSKIDNFVNKYGNVKNCSPNVINHDELQIEVLNGSRSESAKISTVEPSGLGDNTIKLQSGKQCDYSGLTTVPEDLVPRVVSKSPEIQIQLTPQCKTTNEVLDSNHNNRPNSSESDKIANQEISSKEAMLKNLLINPSIPLWLDQILQNHFNEKAILLNLTYDEVRSSLYQCYIAISFFFLPFSDEEQNHIMEQLVMAFGVPQGSTIELLAVSCFASFFKELNKNSD